MTVKTKHTISVEDIVAFEITCVDCQSTLSIPIAKCNKTAYQCPRCQKSWYIGGAAENDALIQLASAMAEIKSQLNPKLNPKFQFRMEITDPTCE